MKRAWSHGTMVLGFVLVAVFVLELSRGGKLHGGDKPERLRFVYVQKEFAPKTQWLIRIYTEALRRMGMGFEFVELPAKRASLYSDSGRVDGELNRIATYGETYTNMVIVPESNLEASFAAFTLDQELNLKDWDSLVDTGYRVGFLRGVLFCERNLTRVLAENQLNPVASLELGIKMLMARRLDVLVFNEAAASNFLKTEEGRKLLSSGGAPVHVCRAGTMGVTRGHAWLHKSHARLAKPLAKVLKDMKSEGLFELYSEQTGFTP